MRKTLLHILVSYLVGAYACILFYALVLGHYGPTHGGYVFFVPYLDLAVVGPAVPPMFAYELIARSDQLRPEILSDTALSLGVFGVSAAISFVLLRLRRKPQNEQSSKSSSV